jgi:N-acyl-L-homoserine lactone synthetase
LGGGALGHLDIIVSVAGYAVDAPTHPWVNQVAPAVIDSGTAAKLSAARHAWEENVLTFCIYNTAQQALKKKIITVFERMFGNLEQRHGWLLKHYGEGNY